MASFELFKLRKPVKNAIDDLGFDTPTPIQEKSFSVILSGKDVLGIAQTGTGKTLAYMLPIIDELTFSNQLIPRVLILVPTRELVVQVAEEIEKFTKYMTVRVAQVYGGVNIKTQRARLAEGSDIVVATPGRLYDLVLNMSLSLKGIKKLVIDEVDVMLDLGFRPQLINIFELMPERRQNIMFSATMTAHVEQLINDFFIAPEKISIALSGARLENIEQFSYQVPNFNTKVNLLNYLLSNLEDNAKALVFVSGKRQADRLFFEVEKMHKEECCIVHSNKSQNYRFAAIEKFNLGTGKFLIATDVMARGLDLEHVTHVFNFDTPDYPENYIHRIGRTGRAEKSGVSILFTTEKELAAKKSIEDLMKYQIKISKIPSEVEISNELTQAEIVEDDNSKDPNRNVKNTAPKSGFHEKKNSNKKTNQGGSYKRTITKKYKKAQTRGDKTYHKRQKRG